MRTIVTYTYKKKVKWLYMPFPTIAERKRFLRRARKLGFSDIKIKTIQC